MNRRGFVRLLAASPLAGALGLKAAQEDTAAKLAKITVGGIPDRTFPQVAEAGLNGSSELAWRLALQSKAAMREVTSAFFEEHRHIQSIDHDIASKRSFSLAAKIAYQRQRNVELSLHALQHGLLWQRFNRMQERLLKAFVP